MDLLGMLVTLYTSKGYPIDLQYYLNNNNKKKNGTWANQIKFVCILANVFLRIYFS